MQDAVELLETLSRLAPSSRAFDLPVDLSEDRLLVLLQYTDIEGATTVGKRVASAVRSYGHISEGPARQHTLSVSIGVSALKPGRPVSFGRLFKDAGSALRAAQLKGGGRVVVRNCVRRRERSRAQPGWAP